MVVVMMAAAASAATPATVVVVMVVMMMVTLLLIPGLLLWQCLRLLWGDVLLLLLGVPPGHRRCHRDPRHVGLL